jgi:quinol-cytochrome oxidoreductase complex cytochrome b subunit
MATSEGLVGEVKISSGVQRTERLGAHGELIVNDSGFGRFFEATLNGRVFCVSTALGATLNGFAAPLGAGGTAVLALFNPAGNNKAASIIKAACTIIPGATATGIIPVWYFIPPNTGITAAGTQAAVSALLGSLGSTMKTFINAAVTGSVAATTLRPWACSGGEPPLTAATIVGGTMSMVEETDGSIIVPPGSLLGVGFNAAGAAETGNVSISWVETEWPL